ncbi:MAG TPA: MarR family transcriptional regulator [Candidatus Limousia pullorum]|uniref:MarR family transcriptional regulator n=1 Tax=Candidatus Limousia pullorum TaxID=2840860 RepID=A0A9D1LY70_9FIRM|nr:MarR family transcriptional regulator [Candidatus Limousia pullorum]
MDEKMPLGLMFAIIDRAFKKKVDKKIQDMELTPVQFRVLGEISHLESKGVEEINQRDLEKVEKITHPAMTGIIQRLESKGFIICTPSPRDKRYKKISCTDKTTDIHKMIDIMDEQLLAELCQGLSQEEIDTYVRITKHIISNINFEP